MNDERTSAVVTFIVRITRDPAGRLCGIVERARTGEKERFAGTGGIRPAIERMLRNDHRDRRRPSRPKEAP